MMNPRSPRSNGQALQHRGDVASYLWRGCAAHVFKYKQKCQRNVSSPHLFLNHRAALRVEGCHQVLLPGSLHHYAAQAHFNPWWLNEKSLNKHYQQ